MKFKTLAAITLIALGIAAFVYQGVLTVNGGRDASIDPMHVTTESTYAIPLPPIIGAIALIGGIAMLLVDKGDFKSTATP